MARRTRSPKLEARTNRLKLQPRTKPYTVMIAPRVHLGYRRNQDGPGSWSVKAHGWLRKFAIADDHEDANGGTVLDYWQALEKAKELARVGEGDRSDAPITVLQAVEDYENDLITRNLAIYNATTLKRCHLPEALASKTVPLLTERDLRDWRVGLIKKGLQPSSADRYATALKSALNIVAETYKLTNNRAWATGLKKTKRGKPRNIILSDQVVAALVRGCYEQGHVIGLIMETLAETGARESQLYRLAVADLQDDNQSGPRLMMPSSMKGSTRKREREIKHRPVPISTRLAKALRLQAHGRAPDAPLFDKILKLSDLIKPVVKRLGLSDRTTPYALRHSSVCRQLLAGVPIRAVADAHDTSVAEIEMTYSHHISDVSEDVRRRSLLDLDAQPTGKVTPIRAA